MFTQSMHNHTYRCNHACGTEREYVESALKGGMTLLGFSDHGPQCFEGDYYSGFRMKHEQVQGYFDVVEGLRTEYAGRIEIHAGFELEYYPALFENTMKLISRYPAEYLIMGQHFLLNEVEDIGSMARSTQEERLKLYVDQCIEGMSTGMFAYAAHPDCIRFEGDPDIYEKHIRRFCENAKKYRMPLEINLLGIRTNRHYPREDFWRIAGEVGNRAVCGSDAHTAEDVFDPLSYEKAHAMADKYGLKLIAPATILKEGNTLK